MSHRTIFTAAITISLAAVGLMMLGPGSRGILQAQRPTATAEATQRAVAAAEAFLATLDSAKRAKANIDLNAKTRTCGRTCLPASQCRSERPSGMVSSWAT